MKAPTLLAQMLLMGLLLLDLADLLLLAFVIS